MTGVLPGLLGALFLTGLMGGLHCAGMCGGILGAVATGAEAGALRRQLAVHAGRIGSYALLGALAGGLGGAAGMLPRLAPVQIGLYVVANVVLLITGAYLMGWRRPMAQVEIWGGGLWRHVAPLTRALLPARTTARALGVGALWGFMPCGLVYGALAMALMAGDAAMGAALMLAFGLGTLPNLLAAGALLRRGAASRWRQYWQRASGALVLAFGVYGLAHATQIGGHLHGGLLCLPGF